MNKLDKNNTKFTLTQHIKDKNNRSVATLLAVRYDDKVWISYSKYNKGAEDVQFSKKSGRDIAWMRITNKIRHDINPGVVVPFVVQDSLSDFILRCKAYFRIENTDSFCLVV